MREQKYDEPEMGAMIIRATARFAGTWNLTVGLETTYCTVTTCF